MENVTAVRDDTPPVSHRPHLSEGQRQLARRAAMLCSEAERLEAMACRKHEGFGQPGEAFDISSYGVMSDRIARIFARLGVGRSRQIHSDAPKVLKSRVVGHFRRHSRREALPP